MTNREKIIEERKHDNSISTQFLLSKLRNKDYKGIRQYFNCAHCVYYGKCHFFNCDDGIAAWLESEVEE